MAGCLVYYVFSHGRSVTVRAFILRKSAVFLEVLIISIKELTINEDIHEKEVRVIDTDGSQLGIMEISKALSLAEGKDLDLVCLSPNATPVVCKIMDYGKYRFDQAKREKESRKNQKVVEVKEIRLGLNTDVHDFETKGNHAKKFLKDGRRILLALFILEFILMLFITPNKHDDQVFL